MQKSSSSDMTNSDNSRIQEEQTIARVRETFDNVAGGYDRDALRFFPGAAAHLADLLNLRGDEHVLDVATGTGHSALEIARRLPEGKVTALDFSAGMLNRARNKAQLLDLQNIEFMEKDMRDLDFPANHFDAAVCAFGIFFVPDMVKQLARIARVVKPGGTVAITSFREDQFHPLRPILFERLVKYGITEFPEAWKRVATEEGCRNLFQEANLKEIKVEFKNTGYYLRNEEEWWDVVWNAGFRRLISRLEPNRLSQFRREHLEEISALKTEQGIWLNVPVFFTAGTRD